MEKLNRQIRRLFLLCLTLSAGLPAGIVGTVLGAVYGMIPVLVLGILFTVLGFYLMPILWVQYADRRKDRTLLFMIEQEYLYTVEGLALQTGYAQEEVRQRIQKLILRHVLAGYLFLEDRLVPNTNEKQTEHSMPTKICPSCGGTMRFAGSYFRCEYCNRIL